MTEISEVLALLGDEVTHAEVADTYGVSTAIVSRIARGQHPHQRGAV